MGPASGRREGSILTVLLSLESTAVTACSLAYYLDRIEFEWNINIWHMPRNIDTVAILYIERFDCICSDTLGFHSIKDLLITDGLAKVCA